MSDDDRTTTDAGRTSGTGPPAATRALPLVIGLGSLDRGDDAVGVAVVTQVAMRGVAARYVECEDPTLLVEHWVGVDECVVIDAVRSGGPAGEVLVLETGADAPPLPENAWARTGRGGTHAFGLAAAVELARALKRLPGRVVVVGVTAESFHHGAPLSEPVAEAVPAAADAVVGIVAGPSAPAPATGGPTRSEGRDVPG